MAGDSMVGVISGHLSRATASVFKRVVVMSFEKIVKTPLITKSLYKKGLGSTDV